jgi:hypothetical protein
MFVKINMNKLNSGKIQVAVYRAEQSAGPVQEYSSSIEAEKVLLGLGIPTETVTQQLDLLAEVGPKELLRFSPMEVLDEVLHSHGFLL